MIVLEQLDEDVAQELIEPRPQDQPLRPQDRDRIVARGDGNPLFLEELLRVRARHRHGRAARLARRGGHARDRRAAADRAARRAARIGARAGVRSGAARAGARGGEPRARRGHARQSRAPPRARRRRSGCASATRCSRRRRTRACRSARGSRSHLRAGEAIEQRAGDNLDEVAPLLSLHFLEAQDWQRTWRYALQAGRLAQAAHAPGEAATHLERAITAARKLGDVPPDEIGGLLTELGAALVTLGVYDRADDAYRRAAAALRLDPLERARIAERRSTVRGEYQGRLTAAIRQVRSGFALLDALPASEIDADRVRAQLLAREADLRYRQGRLRVAAKLCGEAMVVAERSGEHRALAAAMSVLDSCLVELGLTKEATHMKTALELYEELGDQLYVAITLGNLGGVLFFDSKWEQAADYFQRAVDASNKAGDLAGAAIAHVNLGELLVNQGRVEEAEALLTPAVRTLESFEYAVAAAGATLHLGRARAFLGRYDEGAELLRTAAQVLDESQTLVGSIEARARLAEIAVLRGEVDAAAASIEEARALERTLGETPFTALLDRVELTLAVASGDSPRAIAALDDALARARNVGAKYDLLLLLALAEHLGFADGAQERDELARELGVVDLVALVGLRPVSRA